MHPLIVFFRTQADEPPLLHQIQQRVHTASRGGKSSSRALYRFCLLPRNYGALHLRMRSVWVFRVHKYERSQAHIRIPYARCISQGSRCSLTRMQIHRRWSLPTSEQRRARIHMTAHERIRLRHSSASTFQERAAASLFQRRQLPCLRYPSASRFCCNRSAGVAHKRRN